MDNEIMIFNQTSEDIPELDLVKKVLDVQTNEKLAMKIYEKKNFINDINKKNAFKEKLVF